MVIIESHKEWEKFMVEFEENDSVVIPIQCDVNKHPIDTELCLFYIRLVNDEGIPACSLSISENMG